MDEVEEVKDAVKVAVLNEKSVIGVTAGGASVVRDDSVRCRDVL